MAMIDSAKPSVADIAKAARALALELNVVLDVDANATIEMSARRELRVARALALNVLDVVDPLTR